MMKFLELLKMYYKYDEERFRVGLGSGWSVAIELVVGPDHGILYTSLQALEKTRVADFEQV